jgi:hypothetical protein
MWRKLRIIVLLLILAFVALNTYFDRVYSTDWNMPLRVAVYPISGDGADETERFLQKISDDDFAPLEAFFDHEAKHYGIAMQWPVGFSLASRLQELPPALEPRSRLLGRMAWSLRMRWWAWRTPDAPGPAPDIKLFVLYHDPARSPSLPHSIGLQKGLFGIVNVFADRGMMGSNDTVIAHELLHTLGATDKYDPVTNQPAWPDGYAEPDREPRYPQACAELMGGRIPISATESSTPESLRAVVVGPMSAKEIGWHEPASQSGSPR